MKNEGFRPSIYGSQPLDPGGTPWNPATGGVGVDHRSKLLGFKVKL